MNEPKLPKPKAPNVGVLARYRSYSRLRRIFTWFLILVVTLTVIGALNPQPKKAKPKSSPTTTHPVVTTTNPPVTTTHPVVTTPSPPATTPTVNPALQSWATSFYNNYWSSCYPEWNLMNTQFSAASGPYGINSTGVIDNDCGNLSANSPDATTNALINKLTFDELNWSTDVFNTGNGMYANDYQTLNDDFTQLNSLITQDMN